MMARLVQMVLSVAMLSLCGCWHIWWGSRDSECHNGVRYVTAKYRGAKLSTRVSKDQDLSFADQCTESFPLSGFVPCGEGRYPVVFFVPGTIEPYQHGFIMQVLEAISQRGFVAVTVDYANMTLEQDCSLYRPRSFCMFDRNSSQSAVSRVCDHLEQADCGKGIAVLGHSQGALMSVLANNFEDRVRWVHSMAVTSNPPPTAKDMSCLLPGNRRLPSNRLLSVCGQCDVFFNGTNRNDCDARSVGVTRGLKELTAIDCGSEWSCLASNPDTHARFGWIKISNDQVKDQEADHCYMYSYGCLGPTDPEWKSNPELPWALPAIIKDLEAVLRSDGQ